MSVLSDHEVVIRIVDLLAGPAASNMCRARMVRGRADYGELDLGKSRDWHKDALEESADLVNYLAIRWIINGSVKNLEVLRYACSLADSLHGD